MQLHTINSRRSRPSVLRRGRWIGLLGAAAMGLALAVSVGPATAVHDEGFVLQGDVDGNVDWDDLFTSAGVKVNPLPTDFLDAAFRADFALPDASGYATGSKDNLPISLAGQGDWQCKTPNNLGAKFDLVNAYAAAKVGSATGSDPGDIIIYFGSEVSAPEGNRNMGVWLLQDPSVNCSGSGNTDFSGSHRYGDVFIVSAFTGGGSTATIDVYEWVDKTPATPGDDPDVNGQLVLKASVTGATCPPTTQDDACAIANTDGDKNPDETEFEVDTPWPAPDKDGGNINEAQFMEGAVNLTNLGLSGCFSTFLANSRSSQELGSTIHDFARADFNTCATVNGTKYKDANGDGDRDTGEPGLGGWVFDLKQGTTLIATATSDSSGNYTFGSIPAGTYTVTERSQTGWLQTEPASGGRAITVGGGGTATVGAFGNTPLTDLEVEVDPQTADSSQGTIFCVAGTDLSATPHLDGNGAGTGTDVDGDVGATATWDLNGLKPGEYVCKIVITDP